MNQLDSIKEWPEIESLQASYERKNISFPPALESAYLQATDRAGVQDESEIVREIVKLMKAGLAQCVVRKAAEAPGTTKLGKLWRALFGWVGTMNPA